MATLADKAILLGADNRPPMLEKDMTYTIAASESNYGKQRTVICYSCKGEGHMSKECTKPKRKRDDSWFKDKVLLVQAQANGQILHEEELAFLADPGILKDALTEVHNPDNVDNNMINQGVQAAVYNSTTSAQQDALILSVIEKLKTQVINCTKINMDNKTVNDTLATKLERFTEQVKVLKEGHYVEVKEIKEKDKIKAKTGQNQKETKKHGKVNQVKAKVKVKPVKTNHGFGKSTKTKAEG
nr:retrovirus-related Pol polyprotein from transposon TNT 1-94 [Tanacetum cinerariifolium]